MVPVVTAVVGLSSGTCGSSGLRALSSDCVAKAKMWLPSEDLLG